MRTLLTCFILLSCAAVAQTPATKPAAPKNLKGTVTKTAPAENQPATKTVLPTEADVNGFLQHMFGYDPKITWKIQRISATEIPGVSSVLLVIGNSPQPTELLVMPGNKHAIVGQLEVIPFGPDPFADARKKLVAADGPSRGPAGARVTIVEFSDLQCPFCKQSQPTVDKLMQDYPNARLIFENFPLDSIHKWALKAAHYDDCVAQANPKAFWDFVQKVYDVQSDINESNADSKLTDVATAIGLDGAKIAACSATP